MTIGRRGWSLLFCFLFACTAWGQEPPTELAEALQRLKAGVDDARAQPRADEISDDLDQVEGAVQGAIEATARLPVAGPPVDPDYVTTTTDTHLITGAGDRLPLPNVECITVRPGSWHAPETWAAGELPREGCDVWIEHAVTFHGVDPVKYDDVFIDEGGRLEILDETEMRLRTLIGGPGGAVVIGRRDQPAKRVRLIFNDAPLEPADATVHQMGGGIVMGGATFHVFGWSPEQPWILPDRGLMEGEVIGGTFDLPADWLGDPLILGTTGMPYEDGRGKFKRASQNEEGTAALAARYSHPAIHFPGVTYGPPIGHLVRGVTFASENGGDQKTRPHYMFSGRTDLHLDGVRFEHGGRTTMKHIRHPSNQVGRYGGPHCHHLIGPRVTRGTAQYSIRNIVVYRPRRWAITLHAAPWGLVERNVVAFAQGSGINTETGQSRNCTIRNNLVVGSFGAIDFTRGGVRRENRHVDTGGDGGGIWLRSPVGHVVEGNVVAGCVGFGLNINGYYQRRVTLAAKQGDRNNTLVLTRPLARSAMMNFGSCDRNVILGSKGGLWLTWSQNATTINGQLDFARLLISRTDVGHCQIGGELWHEFHTDIDGLRVIGDPSVAALNGGEVWAHHDPRRQSYGLRYNTKAYENSGMAVRGLFVRGVSIGLQVPRHVSRGRTTTSYITGGPVRKEEFYGLDCDIEAYIPVYAASRHSNRRAQLTGRFVHQPDLRPANVKLPGGWAETPGVWLQELGHASNPLVTINGEPVRE